MPIIVENLKHVYSPGTPFESIALRDISFRIEDGEFIGIIGHTGSGKSTLIQHLNGLLKATQGRIWINDLDITGKNLRLTEVRKKVGLVFQYPEYQLFEETIAKDIAFGPEKLGLSPEEVEKRVRQAMELVGLDYQEWKDRSPFEISGGQKRRVAIAGVVAMEPEVLILDEPTAGLDPQGREEILHQIKSIHQRQKTTVLLVSHSMEDISRLSDRLLVMDRGTLAFQGTPKEVFRHEKRLQDIGLGVPKVVELMTALREKGWALPPDIITLEEAASALEEKLRCKGGAPC